MNLWNLQLLITVHRFKVQSNRFFKTGCIFTCVHAVANELSETLTGPADSDADDCPGVLVSLY